MLASNDSPTLQHVGYTFEATTNPAWMALKALPYLMEYPYDCTEQLANRFFANQLAYATVSTRPVLQEVFKKWQADSMALRSELERNPTPEKRPAHRNSLGARKPSPKPNNAPASANSSNWANSPASRKKPSQNSNAAKTRKAVIPGSRVAAPTAT